MLTWSGGAERNSQEGEEHLEDLRGEKRQRWRKLQVSKVGEEN